MNIIEFLEVLGDYGISISNLDATLKVAKAAEIEDRPLAACAPIFLAQIRGFDVEIRVTPEFNEGAFDRLLESEGFDHIAKTHVLSAIRNNT